MQWKSFEAIPDLIWLEGDQVLIILLLSYEAEHVCICLTSVLSVPWTMDVSSLQYPSFLHYQSSNVYMAVVAECLKFQESVRSKHLCHVKVVFY